MAKKRKSILFSLNRCAICGKTKPYAIIETHEVFHGTANRKNSIKADCCVGLCLEHHRIGKDAVHNNPQMRLYLQKLYETRYIELHSYEEFMALFHKNYLDEDEIKEAEQKHEAYEEAYHASKGNLI